MVYFTCNRCGASLKKNNVEKHYNIQCRGPAFVTCVDCLKDFHAEAYIAHTKCITENEKYSAKGFASRPPSFKGEAKHNAWVDLVNHVSQTRRDIPPLELSFLDSLVIHENIPQKKAKFQNFAKNVWRSGKFNGNAVEFVWNLLEAEFKAQKKKDLGNDSKVNEENGSKEKSIENGESTVEKITKKDKKKKLKRDKSEESLEVMRDQEMDAGDGPTDEKTNGDKNILEKKRKRKLGLGDNDESVEIISTLNGNGKMKETKNLQNTFENIESGQTIKISNSKRKKCDEKKRDSEKISSSHSEPSTKKTQPIDVNQKLVPESTENPLNMRFSWSKTIVEVLESALDQELPVKRLRKKVLARFVSTGREVDSLISAKFTKKLSKIPTISLLDDRAKLKI